MDVLKRTPKFLKALGSTGWKKFEAVRDSPKTLGISKVQKVLLSLVYLVSIIGSIVVVFYILTTVKSQSDLQEHYDGVFKAPSVLLCPGLNRKYKHHFWHRNIWIQELGLSVEAVNIVAEAAKNGELMAAEVKTSLDAAISKSANASGMSPKEIWKHISSSQYNEFELFPYFESEKCAPEAGCYDLIKHDRHLALDFECEYGGLDVKGYFNCSEAKGIWLRDNSYCLFWNNTDKNFKGDENDQWMKLWNFDHDRRPYRVWVGNLETEQVNATEINSLYDTFMFLPYYIDSDAYDKVCQPHLNADCGRTTEKGKNYWHFALKKTDTYRHWRMKTLTTEHLNQTQTDTGELIVNIDDYEIFNMHVSGETRWYHVRKRATYNQFQRMEVIGNVIGFSVGLSLFSVIKMMLLFIEKRKLLVNLIQILSGLILLTVSAVLMYLDFQYFKDVRFRNKYDIISETGVPYPDIQIFPRYLGILNTTTLEKYNVSWQLLMYITTVATLRRQTYWIESSGKGAKDFFLWHKESPAELRYHWDFMLFHLQSVSQELYETHMRRVEREYDFLAKKMKADPEDIWLIYTNLLLQPCDMIAFCYIDGKYVKYCCQYFHHYKLGQNTIEFRNPENRLLQTNPGPSNGLKIYANPTAEYHRGDRMWFDSYFKSHIRDCKVRYNCTDEYPSSWSAVPMWYTYINEFKSRGSNYIFGSGHWQVNYAVERTENSQLDYKPNDKEPCTTGQSLNMNKRLELAYLIAELMSSVCDCYPCHVPGLREFSRKRSCCTPKETGKCLTRPEFTVHATEENRRVCGGGFCNPWTMRNFLASPQKFNDTYEDIKLHTLTNCEHCTDVLSMEGTVGTALRKAYQNAKIDRSPFLRPCKKVTYSIRGASTTLSDDREWVGNKSELLLNFYFENIYAIKFEEVDLQNLWELFSLFCGGVGLSFGISIIAVFELLTEVALKVFQKKTKLFFSNFSSYTLKKFKDRFKSNLTPVEPLNNTFIELHGDEVEENDNGGSADKVQPPNSNDTVNAIRWVVLVAAISLSAYFGYRFWLSEKDDQISVDYYLSRQVQAPNLAICTDPSSIINLDDIPKKFLFGKCATEKTELDCSSIFAVVLKLGVVCVLTDFQGVEESFQSMTVEIFSPNPIYAWAGGRIYKDFIEPVVKAEEESISFISYQQTEIINQPQCGTQNDMVDCPKCGSQSSASFCCMQNDVQFYNVSERNTGKYCQSSFYSVDVYSRKASVEERKIRDGMSVRIIKIVPALDTKPQLIRKWRYSWGQKLMTYTSYIDLFIGINLDNVIYFFFGWLKSLFFSLSG